MTENKNSKPIIKKYTHNELFDAYKTLGAEALKANHYELPIITGIGTAVQWKDFLICSDVDEYIQNESTILRSIELRKLILNATKNDHSVGTAQLINAVSAIDIKQTNKKGDTVIYSYIQPNEQQKKASNVRRISKDPFLK